VPLGANLQGYAMLLALAAVFAVVNGANDGGAMLAASLKAPGVRLITAIAMFALALAVVPALVGGGVVQTLTSGLVDAPDGMRSWLIGVGALAAMLVVMVLTAGGLPTSLTLGMVGGIVGAGLGRGLPVQVGGVGRVLLIGLAAPVAGALVAQAMMVIAAAVTSRPQIQRLGWVRRVVTAVQAIAYAANDGQKMLAVLAVTSVGVTSSALVVVAVLFALGCVIGMAAAAGTLGSILRTTPREEVTAQLAGSAAVLVSAALGAPVSMTQAVAGGMVGTGLLRGRRQVRWRVAGQLAVAWVLTLPAAGVVGALAGWIIWRLM
jgi:PiT family inorganic phosphate transporter